MSSLRRRISILIASLAALAVLATSLPTGLAALLWHWEQNPVLRGGQLAADAGCLACHQPLANLEIPNAGSRWGSIPRFGAGNGLMYNAESREEIEEYIRFGAPRVWLDRPESRERLASQQIRMPAYEDHFTEKEIADLVAWTTAMEGIDPPGEAEGATGRQLARQHGCLSCHGLDGSGGKANPGALGGFIPGFLGKNFTDLVRDEGEFRGWIREGTNQRLAANPLVALIWRRQKISMPAYGDLLSDEQISEIWRWIQSSRAVPKGPVQG